MQDTNKAPIREMEAPKPLPPEETAMFCEQVALILRAGIPMHEGVEALCENYMNTRYGAPFRRLNEILLETGSLFEAVKGLSIFPGYMVYMVRIGEQAGTLDDVMQGLSEYYEREAQIRATVKNAIFYPMMLVVMMAAVVLVLVVKVLPMFSQILRNLGGEMSQSAAVVMNVGMTAGAVVLGAAAFVLAAAVVLFILLRTRLKSPILAFLKRHIRPLRRIAEKLAAARFSSVMSMMMGSGFPMEEAVDLAADVVGDEDGRAKVLHLSKLMGEGVAFPDAAKEARLFQPIHEKMIRVGFLAGQTDVVMKKLAELYQDEVDDAIRRLVSIIEPTLVAVLSVIIGGILLQVMLPLAGILSSIA